MDALSEILPVLAEPLGIAALGAMAIWAGVRVLQAVIAAVRDVELARLALSQTLAETLAEIMRAQAGAVGGLMQAQADQARETRELGILLRLIARRTGLTDVMADAQGGDPHDPA